MKKIILAFVALITMTSVQAQDDNNSSRGERRRFDRTEMLKNRTNETVKKYGLNEEQAAKLLELNTKYADQMGSGMGAPRNGRRGGARPAADRGGNRQQGKRPEMTEEQRQNMEKQRAERQAAMEQYAIELQAIMTPDQYKAYKADAESRMREGGRRGGPRGEQKQD